VFKLEVAFDRGLKGSRATSIFVSEGSICWASALCQAGKPTPVLKPDTVAHGLAEYGGGVSK